MLSKKEILKQALDNYDESIAVEERNRRDALISSRFVDGHQWPEEIKKDRERKKRPSLTINKLRKFVHHLGGEIQRNRADLTVVPTDSKADALGAVVRSKIIKYIETISDADAAYDHSIAQMLEGGYGFFRLLTGYANNSDFDQDILIEKIPNRFSVVLDSHAQKHLFEDAKYAFIIDTMSRKSFEKEYGKNKVGEFDAPKGMSNDVWYTKDSVRVAEYFFIVPEKIRIFLLDDDTVLNEKDLTEAQIRFPEIINRIVRERTIETNKVYWVKLTRNKILEGPYAFPGAYIPIVPVLGYEHNDEGYRCFRSLVHDALDSMKMFNYWKTYATEMIALAPKAPYLVTPEQISGFTDDWQQANNENYVYLYYNMVGGLGAPKREPPPPIPSAAINEANMASLDIQDTIGMYPASMGQPSNERSGRAILARQAPAQNTFFHFVNNFQKALLFAGKVILKMIPEVYDTKRIIKMMGTNGIEELRLNYPNVDLVTSLESIENDMGQGEYSVTAALGPNFATQRQQTAASMLDFLQFAPHTAPIILPRLANLMDWEGSQSLGDELTQLLTNSNSENPNALSGSAPRSRNTASP
jgi:hypothetical protein